MRRTYAALQDTKSQGSGHVLPRPSGSDRPYGSGRYSITCGQFGTASTAGPDLPDLIGRELAVSVSHPTIMPVTQNLVAHVLSLRTQDKVVRVHARRVVTRMPNDHVRWVSSVKKHRHAMRSPSRLANPENPVPVLVSCSFPLPAFLRRSNVDFRPKPLNNIVRQPTCGLFSLLLLHHVHPLNGDG